ncbi:SPOR domain-containing protein [Planktotalea sp.]|uniref:SPOR domain-containing protein n=1 Tax=Planktotalea sp. TaxID=2029877 RepID=UPI0032968E3D
MNVKRFLVMSLVAASCAISVSEVSAQALSRDSGPAEIPPASFKGSQYVDSKGCVYIRAGVDGNTNWVPRVSRSREVVCGLTPSIAGSAAGTAVAAAPQSNAPVEIGTNSVVAPKSPAPEVAAPVVQPKRKTVSEVLAPKPIKTVASKPAAKPAPVVKPAPKKIVRNAPRVQQAQPRIVQIAPQPAPVAVQPRRVVVQSNGANGQVCQGASSLSQRYIGGRGLPVRCGPQTTAFQNSRAGGTVAAGTTSGVAAAPRAAATEGVIYRNRAGQVVTNVSPNARIVPRHVYEQQQAAHVASPTPNGYRPVWEDDRLNTKRAHQSPKGKAATEVVWSKTVPRRLIVRSTGRDVTRSFPGLRYPYTSLAQQRAAGVQVAAPVVSSKGTVAKRVVRKQPAQVQARTTTPRKPAQVAGKKFVQVGTFGVPSNAQNTANRLQRMGLPVRIGKFTRGGKQMRIVLAGPFASPAHTNGALTVLRNAGFRDAFARN